MAINWLNGHFPQELRVYIPKPSKSVKQGKGRGCYACQRVNIHHVAAVSSHNNPSRTVVPGGYLLARINPYLARKQLRYLLIYTYISALYLPPTNGPETVFLLGENLQRPPPAPPTRGVQHTWWKGGNRAASNVGAREGSALRHCCTSTAIASNK